MANQKKETAGELYRKATADNTRYDAIEVGHALTDDTLKNVWKCIDDHLNVLDTEQFCVVLLICDDNILKNAKRMKYYAWPFLPDPRPRQSVFHYSRTLDSIQRLWTLPNAKVMATISSMPVVDNKWLQTKGWCDAFYKATKKKYYKMNPHFFHQYIRTESGVSLLSEKEHIEKLKGNSHKVSQSAHDQIDTLFSKSFDPFKPFERKVINSD